MTEQEKKLITGRRSGQIGEQEFIEKFSLGEYLDSAQIDFKVQTAIINENAQELESLIYLLLWILPNKGSYINTLNTLLVTSGHQDHQEIARSLQTLKSPSTIPYARKALQSNFDYLAYTCSDKDAIAKWFSWLLVDIGTDEAIQVLEEYSHSADAGIRNEMLYRLRKLGID